MLETRGQTGRTVEPKDRVIVRKVSDVDIIFIRLDINAEPSLSVVLGADGIGFLYGSESEGPPREVPIL